MLFSHDLALERIGLLRNLQRFLVIAKVAVCQRKVTQRNQGVIVLLSKHLALQVVSLLCGDLFIDEITGFAVEQGKVVYGNERIDVLLAIKLGT